MLDWKVWKAYLAYYRGARASLALSVVFAIAQTCLLAPLALLTRLTFDQLIPQKNFSGLLQIAALMLLMYLASHGLALYNRYLCLQITKRSIQKMRNELIDKIYALSRHFFTSGDHSKIHTAIVQDTERVDVMSNAIVSVFLPSASIALGLCLVLAYLDLFLFGVTAATIPPLVFLARKLHQRAYEKVKHFHRDFEDFSSGILFTIRKMDLTRAQAAEDGEIGRQKQIVDRLRQTSSSMAWSMSRFSAIQNSLLAVAGLVVLIAGGWQVLRGRLSTGELLSFYVGLALLREQARQLVESLPHIAIGKQSLNSLFSMMRLEDASPYHGTEQIAFRGEIQVEGLHFAYDKTEVLRDLALKIEPRKIHLLAGPSGAGKSTLLKLLLGFYAPQQGNLLADGIPYSEIDFKHFRRQIGIILQDAFLFSGTIAENLRYGSPEANDEAMRRAAQLATADDFIRELPQGYDTQVGEDGVRLSGGQCQRLAVARALLKTPAMLIFDEPTAHLDPDLVGRLVKNLRGLAQESSILIVSHDPRLFPIADRILFLENGQLRSGEDMIQASDKLQSAEGRFPT